MAGTSNRRILADYISKQSTFGKNYILNESGHVNNQNITVSGATVARNTTTPLTSIADLQVGYTAAAQYAEWSMESLDRSLAGRNCEIRADYKLALGSGATVIAAIYQAGVSVASTTLQANTTSLPLSFNAPCGTSSTTFRVTQSVGAVVSTLNIANITYGIATNISNQGLDTDWQDYTLTLGGTTTPPTLGSTTINKARWRRVGDSMEVDYQLRMSTDGTDGSGVYLFPLPTGYLIDTTKFTPDTNVSTTGLASTNVGTAAASIADSVATYHAGFVGVYNTSNFVLQFPSAGGPMSSSILRIGTGGSPRQVSFRAFVPIAGWTTQSAVDGSQSKVVAFEANTASNASSAAAPVLYTNIVNDTHSAYNAATGKYTVPVSGWYSIVGQSYWGATAATLYQYVNGVQGYQAGNISSTQQGSANVSIKYLNRGDTVEFRPDVSATVSGGAPLNKFMMAKVDGSLSAPVLIGSVTSNSTGAERIERVTISNNGSVAAIVNQSGSWVSSVSRTGVGAISINITSGMFTAAPNCQVTVMGRTSAGSAQNGFAYIENNATPSTSLVKLQSANAADAGVDLAEYYIHCMGPRS